MFERFTREARQVVVAAQQEARQLQHSQIGTEHLLLGLLNQPETVASEVLVRRGLTRQRAVELIARYVGRGDLDAEALGTLGIDVEAVREKVEATFGRGALDEPARSRRRTRPNGHIPFMAPAKKALELSLREAVALKHNHIGDGHILLGLLREGRGTAMQVIRDCGIDPDDIRRGVTATLGP